MSRGTNNAVSNAGNGGRAKKRKWQKGGCATSKAQAWGHVVVESGVFRQGQQNVRVVDEQLVACKNGAARKDLVCQRVRFRLESGKWTGHDARGVDRVELTLVVARKTGRNGDYGGVNAV
jgi:hypothetical protein